MKKVVKGGVLHEMVIKAWQNDMEILSALSPSGYIPSGSVKAQRTGGMWDSMRWWISEFNSKFCSLQSSSFQL